jgi:hypothetical protein
MKTKINKKEKVTRTIVKRGRPKNSTKNIAKSKSLKENGPFWITSDMPKSKFSRRGDRMIDMLINVILKLSISDIQSVAINPILFKEKKEAINLVNAARYRLKKQYPKRYYTAKTVKDLKGKFAGIRIFREA